MGIVEGEPDPFDIVLDVGNGKPPRKIEIFKPEIEQGNAIKEELASFHNAIVNDQVPIVSGEDGMNALEVALQIMEKLKFSGNLV